MSAVAENKIPLTSLQLELLKSLKYMASEEQVAEIKSLLRYYFTQQLDAAINKAESINNFTAEIYENWLNSKAAGSKDFEAA
jgi:hypothetical protein